MLINCPPGPFYQFPQNRKLGYAEGPRHQSAEQWPCFKRATLASGRELGTTALISVPSHPRHLHPSPQFQQRAYDLIFPSSLLLCTAQLTECICVYCAISAEYSEQGNDRQQRPGADALALCITSYLRRMRPSSSLKPGCVTDSSF